MEAERIASEYAESQSFPWKANIRAVFRDLLENHFLVPGNIKASTDEKSIESWVRKFIKGYENRTSVTASNMPGTIADPVVDIVISHRLQNLNNRDIRQIQGAHRLSMNAEKIIGDLLEDYIHTKLEPFGWYCAWGSTLKATDFVVPQNTAKPRWQIKNRDNSENSSSKAIRKAAREKGVKIDLWFRTFSKTGITNWPALNDELNIDSENDPVLSEESFRRFVGEIIENNPDCLAIENDNYYNPNG